MTGKFLEYLKDHMHRRLWEAEEKIAALRRGRVRHKRIIVRDGETPIDSFEQLDAALRY